MIVEIWGGFVQSVFEAFYLGAGSKAMTPVQLACTWKRGTAK